MCIKNKGTPLHFFQKHITSHAPTGVALLNALFFTDLTLKNLRISLTDRPCQWSLLTTVADYYVLDIWIDKTSQKTSITICVHVKM